MCYLHIQLLKKFDHFHLCINLTLIYIYYTGCTKMEHWLYTNVFAFTGSIKTFHIHMWSEMQRIRVLPTIFVTPYIYFRFLLEFCIYIKN